jgi:hypothetical protein
MPVALPPVINPRFRFRRGALEPPGLWVTSDDVLVFRLRGSAPDNTVLEGRLRILSPRLVAEDIRVLVPVNPAQEFTRFVTWPLFEGFLQGVSVSDASPRAAPQLETIRPGQIYVSLSLGKGDPSPHYEHTVLAQGYVQRYSPVGWPGGASEAPGGGLGRVLVHVVPDPAAGVEWEFSPTLGVCRVMGATAILTTSAVAGNRLVFAVHRTASGGAVVFASFANFTQVAATVFRYSAADFNAVGLVGAAAVSVPWPERYYIPRGQIFALGCSGLLAGDQWTAGFVHAEQWAGSDVDA